MLLGTLLSTLALTLSTLTLLPSASASYSNFTLRTPEKRTTGWTSESCANVAGTYQGHSYNFGCLCASDVQSFCANNNINSEIQGLLLAYVS